MNHTEVIQSDLNSPPSEPYRPEPRLRPPGHVPGPPGAVLAQPHAAGGAHPDGAELHVPRRRPRPALRRPRGLRGQRRRRGRIHQ